MAFRISSFNITDMQGKNYQPYFNASNLRFLPISNSLSSGMLFVNNGQVETYEGITNSSLNINTETNSSLEFNDNMFSLRVENSMGNSNDIIVNESGIELSTRDNLNLSSGITTINSGLIISGSSSGSFGDNEIQKTRYLQFYQDIPGTPAPYTLTLPEITGIDNGIIVLVTNISTQTLTIQQANPSQPIYQGGIPVASISFPPNRSIQLIGLWESVSNIRWIYQFFA